MTLIHDWRQAGTTRRAHLTARMTHPLGFFHANMSACGMVRFAAWAPEGESVRCGLCKRLAKQAEARGANMVATPAWEQFQRGGES